MGKEQFLALMPYISADLVAMIVDRQNISEEEAVNKLYASQLYSALESEDTKVWQYSTHMLYDILDREGKTGNIQFPDI